MRSCHNDSAQETVQIHAKVPVVWLPISLHFRVWKHLSRNFGGRFWLAHDISLAYYRKILVSRLSNNARCVCVIGWANSCRAFSICGLIQVCRNLMAFGIVDWSLTYAVRTGMIIMSFCFIQHWILFLSHSISRHCIWERSSSIAWKHSLAILVDINQSFRSYLIFLKFEAKFDTMEAWQEESRVL